MMNVLPRKHNLLAANLRKLNYLGLIIITIPRTKIRLLLHVRGENAKRFNTHSM